MTIIVFLVDTSASMNQRTYLGTTLLDVAKSAIESFLKIRARDPSSRGMDRYMLLSFQDPPNNVKAGWRESQAVFQSELRSLRAAGETELGSALGAALDLLNINRLQSGIDNYGQGRYPHWLEPAVVVTITDGDRLSPTQANPNPQTISVPRGTSLGSELTLEPFRWDQRVFGIVLRLPGHAPRPSWQPNQMIPSDTGPLDPMCEVTGGRSFCIRSHKALAQCLESLATKMQSGIVVSFEKFGPDPAVNKEEPLTNGYPEPKTNGLTESTLPNGLHPTQERPEPETEDSRAWEVTRKMVFVPRTLHKGYQGFWPFPEAFWPNIQASTLPPRTAHPVLRFSCEATEPAVLAEFPWDKYEMEPSPLTLKILSSKQPSVVWQVFMEGSGRDATSIIGKTAGLGCPFGYLKASSDLRLVNLVLLPYNYPLLFPLIEELRTKLKNKVTGSWRLRFEAYLRQIPPYYYEPLRKALGRIGLGQIMPDRSQDMVFSYSVNNYLQRVKYKAKEEFERLVGAVQARTNMAAAVPTLPGIRPHKGVSLVSVGDKELVGRLLDAQESGETSVAQALRDFRVFLRQPRNPSLPKGGNGFRNAFDIPRSQLLSQISRMRLNLRQELAHPHRRTLPQLSGGLPGSRLSVAQAEILHQLPVGQMGNYQEYLSRMPAPLRELEAAPLRTHAFGNPFKIDKNLKNVDEINLDGVGGPQAGTPVRSGPKRGDLSKRQAGISHHKRRGLPKGYKYKRRRLDSETGSVVSDSGMETDSDASSGYSTDASDRLAPPTPEPEPGSSSPPRKKMKREPSPGPVFHGEASTSQEAAHPVPPENLFKDKTRQRQSYTEETKVEAKVGLSPDALAIARRQISAVIRSGGRRKASSRLREIWEWGVDEAADQILLLDFAMREARRFKAHTLLAALTPERQRLNGQPP